MRRRKLTAYTLCFAAGITAGFFIYERSRTFEVFCFIASVLLLIFCIDADDSCTASFRDRAGERAGFSSTMALFLAAGILLLGSRHSSYLADISHAGETASLNCIILSYSVSDDKLKLRVKNTEEEPSTVLITADCRTVDNAMTDVFGPGADPSELLGAEIRVNGEFRELLSSDDPGCFDYSLYMKARGIGIGFKASGMEITDPGDSFIDRYRRFLYRKKELFLSRFDEDTSGFIRGVIFGDKSEMDEDTVREFNDNSTGHILAVSGLHMGFLYGLLRFLSGKKRSPLTTFIIILIMLVYGDMTMWSSATVRAFLVISTRLLSVHLRRPFDLLTSVSLSALLILIREPYQLFDTGFQLSFCAMAGMAVIIKPVSSALGEALGVMISVQAATIPVIAFTYGCIDPLSIFINVPIILLASVLVPLCILMLMLEIISFTAPAAAFDLAELISYAVIRTNHILSFNGSFTIMTAGLSAAAVIVFFVIIIGMSSEWTRIKLLRKEYKTIIRTGILLLIPALMLSTCLYDRFSDDEIIFVAVGQGDCTHIRYEGKNILIDGGGQAGFGIDRSGSDNSNDSGSSDGYNVGEKILKPYLLREGAGRVELALVTHLHTDHYKGIAELSEVYPVGAIGIPADYRGADLSDLNMSTKSFRSSESAGDPHTSDSGDPYTSDSGDPSTSDSGDPYTSDSGDSYTSDSGDPHISYSGDYYSFANTGLSKTGIGGMRLFKNFGDMSDNRKGPELIYIEPGSKIKLSEDVSIEVIWPVKTGREPLAADDPNEHNTVYMINYRGIRAMITGDLLEEDEIEMVEYYKGTETLKCDVLKVAHHGSKSSSSEAFLDAASPSIAVIQVGRNNFYGHPHAQTLERLEERGIKVFRTDESGAVGIDIHGSGRFLHHKHYQQRQHQEQEQQQHQQQQHQHQHQQQHHQQQLYQRMQLSVDLYKN